VTRRLASILGAGLLLYALLSGLGHAGNQASDGKVRTMVDEAGQVAVSEIDKAIARARPLLERYGYPAVFVAVGVEGAGIPAPGQTLLIAGAIDAVHGGLHIVILVALAVVAAILGNSIGYVIGRVGGRPVLHKLPISEARLSRVDALFRRYGGAFILLARFFDGARQLNGIMAGMLEMPWWRFSLWNLLGALIWVGVWGLGTWWLDRDIGAVLAVVERIEPLAIALVIALLLAGLAYLWHRRRGVDAAGGEQS
jgi:membrane protein DedA with SNARE-associated domain